MALASSVSIDSRLHDIMEIAGIIPLKRARKRKSNPCLGIDSREAKDIVEASLLLKSPFKRDLLSLKIREMVFMARAVLNQRDDTSYDVIKASLSTILNPISIKKRKPRKQVRA